MYSGGPLPEELLPQVKVPVRILWGENDPWEPIEMGRKAYANFPCVDEFVTLRGIESFFPFFFLIFCFIVLFFVFCLLFFVFCFFFIFSLLRSLLILSSYLIFSFLYSYFLRWRTLSHGSNSGNRKYGNIAIRER